MRVNSKQLNNIICINLQLVFESQHNGSQNKIISAIRRKVFFGIRKQLMGSIF